MSKENILRCLVHFLFRDAKGTFSAGSPVSCLLRFLRRIHKIASIIAASATKTTGTAIAAFVPDDSPPPVVDFAKAEPSFAAAEDDVVLVVVVPAPDADAADDVSEDAAEVDAGDDVDTGLLPDEALDAGVAVGPDVVLGTVEVAKVVGADDEGDDDDDDDNNDVFESLLRFDFNDARTDD